MSERKPKVIKKDKRQDIETEIQRQEDSLLKLLITKKPEKAARFLAEVMKEKVYCG